MVESKKKVDNVFDTLSKINVNKNVEKKGRFNYLIWKKLQKRRCSHNREKTLYGNTFRFLCTNLGKSKWY